MSSLVEKLCRDTLFYSEHAW